MHDWMRAMGLDFPLDIEHSYLQDNDLANFSQKLIENAYGEILVVNPFVDECSLGDLLWKAADGH